MTNGAASVDTILARIRERGFAQERPSSVKLLKAFSREASRLHEISITTPERRLLAYIKQYRLHSTGDHARLAERAANDFELTARLHKTFASIPRMSVPRPLACYPELLAIVFEKAPGDNLQQLITGSGRGWPSKQTLKLLAASCAESGAWLRRFQQEQTASPLCSIENMWNYVDIRLSRLVDHPQARFDNRLRQQIRRYFERLEATADLDLRTATAHADFSPGNILVHDSGITVLDFAMAHGASIYLDVAKFCHHLDLLMIKPIFRPRVVEQLKVAFLQGYQPDFKRNSMYEAHRLLYKITHLTRLSCTRDVPVHERFYNQLVCRNHKKWLDQKTRAM